MRVSLKPACPDCGKRNLWINYIFRRRCPNCKVKFVITKYSMLSCFLVFAVFIATPIWVIIEDGFCSFSYISSLVIILFSSIIAIAISPFALRFKSKKTGKEISPPPKPTLLQNYQNQTGMIALFMSYIIFLFFIMSRYFKLFLPDYLMEPYPMFTKLVLWLVPATMDLAFATALIVALGYFLFGAILLKTSTKRKLFSSGIRLFSNSYRYILFITAFVLAGLLMPLIPYCLNLSGKDGHSAIEISNKILFILLFAIPILWWLIRKKINSNYSISLLNKKLILFAIINPLFIIFLILGELFIIRKVAQPVLVRYKDLGSEIIRFIAGNNLVYGLLSLCIIFCIYFIFFVKRCNKKRKFPDRIQFCLYVNSFSILILTSIIAILTASLTNFLSMFINGCAYCRIHDSWCQEKYSAINWLTFGIVVTVTILIFILSKKTKYRSKCKWIYLISIVIFAIYYFPVNKTIHPPVIRMGFINKQGTLIIAPKFIKFYNDTLFKSGLCNVYFTRYSLWQLAGFINKKGEWEISPKFQLAYPFSEGFSHVVVTDKDFKYKDGFIDLKGKYFKKPKYDGAHSFFDGMAFVKIETWKQEYGYINKKGKHVIQNLYFADQDFSEGLVRVMAKANLKGEAKITETPKKIESANEESMFYDEKQTLNAFEHRMVTFIDKSGKFAILNKNKNPMLFLKAGNFSEGLAWVKVNVGGKLTRSGNDSIFEDNKKNSKIGFINKSGDFIIKPQFHYAKDFKEGMAPVKLRGLWGFVNRKGQIVVKFKYADVYDFSEGLARVRSNGKCGFIDKSGKEVIPLIFNGAGDFHEGLAPAIKNGLWGFIDKTGKFVIKPQFYYARRFSEGMAAVDVKMEY